MTDFKCVFGEMGLCEYLDCDNCKRSAADFKEAINARLKETYMDLSDDNKVVDNVNHPQHYISKNGLEVIDVIDKYTAGLTGCEAVYTANILKYILRWHHKNGIEDLKKAQWYLNRLIDSQPKKNIFAWHDGYKKGKTISSTDVVEAFVMDLDGAQFWIAWNIIDLIHGWKYNHGAEDLKKASIYLERLITLVDKDQKQ